MSETTVTMYRCEKCGKWSHAQRKPRWHQRFTFDEPDDPDEILSEEYALGGGFSSGWFVKCGPFTAWTARKERGDE